MNVPAEMTQAPTLSRSELVRLARRAELGDVRARQEIVNRNLRLVLKVVSTMAPSATSGSGSADHDDLVQAGVVGLIQAVDKFDYRRGGAFSTYAVPWITGEVIATLNEMRKVCSMPNRHVSLAHRAGEFVEAFMLERDHCPSLAEIAAGVGAPVDTVHAVLQSRRSASLDDPEGNLTPLDTGAAYDAFALCELRLLLAAAECSLTRREREVLRRRYINEESIEDIRAALGVSVRSIHTARSSALSKLREFIGDEPRIAA